jgi:hypothetical protein
MIHCASQSLGVVEMKQTGFTALIALYNAALQNCVTQANEADEYLDPASMKITLSVSAMGQAEKPSGEPTV